MIRRTLFCAALGLLLFSCSKDLKTENDDVVSVSFSIDDVLPGEDDEPGTKVTLDADGTDLSILWNLSDTLGVFPQTGAQVFFSPTSEGQTFTSFDGGGWAFKSGANYYSYFPFIGDIYLNRNHIPVSFGNQTQDGITDTNIAETCFMYTSPTSVENESLKFQYHLLTCILRVRATLPAGTYTNLTVTAPTDAFVAEGYYDLMASTPTIIPTRMSNQISTRLKNITLTSQQQVIIYLTHAPTNLKNVNITVSVLNSEQTEYQQTKTPSVNYIVGTINSLTCNALVAVPQSMGLIVDDWEDDNHQGQAQ